MEPKPDESSPHLPVCPTAPHFPPNLCTTGPLRSLPAFIVSKYFNKKS